MILSLLLECGTISETVEPEVTYLFRTVFQFLNMPWKVVKKN